MLTGQKVYIANGSRAYEKPFRRLGADITPTLDRADIVCFTGGIDVHPDLYGEKADYSEIHYSALRDGSDVSVYKNAVANSKVMVGICRGSQFLCAMVGGKLHQNILGHLGDHKTEYLGSGYTVTSTHHQAVKELPESAEVLSLAHDGIIEGWMCPKSKILGVQWHPEHAEADSDSQILFNEHMEVLYDNIV